jgi:D-glycerate 3-kinase
LANLLVFLLQQHRQIKAVSLSIDDFYFTLAEREQLAQSIHPLLRTRGVPGTHDVSLAMNTLDALINGEPVSIPRFNKAADDRYSPDEWEVCREPVEIIILEGWCMGATFQSYAQLCEPINLVEKEEDTEHIWRSYINCQLFQPYAEWFRRIDQWVMLKAPSFACVYQWRLEQEQKLRQQHTGQALTGMEDEALKRFVLFYQRITEHLLDTFPTKADYVFELDAQRKVVGYQEKTVTRPQDMSRFLLIFTDLDGSLLNHDDYDFSAAKPTLQQLGEQGIPVIPCTSKTLAELMELRLELDNHCPFIVENGAAVFIPIGAFSQQPKDTVQQGQFWVKSLTPARAYWLTLIEATKPRFGQQFTHFNAMTIEEIMGVTGLSESAAIKAAQRQYGEPVLWQGNETDKKDFIAVLKQKGATVLQGGRFLHVSGATDKAKAMNWLAALYQSHMLMPRDVITLAIGDSGNDIAMLDQADIALLIRSPAHDFPVLNRTHDKYLVDEFAPLGWKQGVAMILDKLNNKEENNG